MSETHAVIYKQILQSQVIASCETITQIIE